MFINLFLTKIIFLILVSFKYFFKTLSFSTSSSNTFSSISLMALIKDLFLPLIWMTYSILSSIKYFLSTFGHCMFSFIFNSSKHSLVKCGRTGEKIINIHFNDIKNVTLDHNLQSTLEINQHQFEELNTITNKLLSVFSSIDASTIEINPLVLNKQGSFVLLDAKISLDDNALFRHPDLLELKDLTEEDPLELQAAEHDMNYVKLDGSIGCMVNGAGLAMATMDIIKQFGEEPANFLDLGGTANKDRVIMGFKTIQSDPNVKSILINIFGGIIHCDMIANGIVEAVKELNFKLPLVVRFQGTNASQGRDVINNSSLGLISIDDFTEAAKKVVELAKE